MPKRVTAQLFFAFMLITAAFLTTAASANFISLYMVMPGKPITDKPIILLQLPNETVVATNSLSVSFTVTIPNSWGTQNFPVDLGNGTQIYEDLFFGAITSITCQVDQNVILHNTTTLGLTTDYNGSIRPANYPMSYNYKPLAYNLSAGQHQVMISVEAYTEYAASEYTVGSVDVSTNLTSIFVLRVAPSLVLSVQNETYDSPDVPLDLQVSLQDNSSTYSWLGYSLDNQANITIVGNSTLTGLAEGSHSITAYANDTFGDMGKSNTIYFNVALPSPAPTPPPSPSPVSSSTKSPSPSIPEFSTWVILPILLAIVATAITARKKLTSSRL